MYSYIPPYVEWQFKTSDEYSLVDFTSPVSEGMFTYRVEVVGGLC